MINLFCDLNGKCYYCYFYNKRGICNLNQKLREVLSKLNIIKLIKGNHDNR